MPHASQSFTYDDASRLQTVTEGDDIASYCYLANSPLVGQIEFKHAGAKRMTTTKNYDRLNRLKQIQSGMGVSPISSFAYDYNAANQRVKASLEDGSAWDYSYDSLGQVISGKKQQATRASQPDESFDYQHDDIGNRKEAGGQASARTSYAANALNQYTQRVDTQAPTKTETLQYDTDGNQIADGTWKYTWDAENRLAAMASGPSVSPEQRQRLEFAYDSQSRRISKKVFAGGLDRANFSLQPSAFSLFVYDGWNLLAELTSDLRPLSSFVWGLDLSGSSQGAGGVVGLLFINDRQAGPGNCHAVAYDGNGNVIALVDSQTGNASAQYNHGPFGELIKSTGSMAKSNPFRFSTKYTDDKTDLIYYGFRYFQPSMGRWLSRDPIMENGGMNIYAFVNNNPVNNIDRHGLDIHFCPTASCSFRTWINNCLDYVRSTGRGAELLAPAEETAGLICPVTSPNNLPSVGADRTGETLAVVYMNPQNINGLPTNGGELPSTERPPNTIQGCAVVLGHELGHATFDGQDEEYNANMLTSRNVRDNENPIRQDLNISIRLTYNGFEFPLP